MGPNVSPRPKGMYSCRREARPSPRSRNLHRHRVKHIARCIQQRDSFYLDPMKRPRIDPSHPPLATVVPHVRVPGDQVIVPLLLQNPADKPVVVAMGQRDFFPVQFQLPENPQAIHPQLSRVSAEAFPIEIVITPDKRGRLAR